MKLLILAVAVTLGKHIATSEKDLGKTKVFFLYFVLSRQVCNS